MSSAARFLLEFEATGDQEVVAKIKAVGAAGKETATDLESLRGIEDPFEPIATGAESAVAPIEGVGTAAEAAVTPLGELGTAAEEGVTSLTDIGSAADTAITPIEGVGTATEGLGGIFSGAGTEVDTFGGSLDAVGTSGEAAAGGLTDANTMVGDFGDSASTSADQSAGFGDTVKGMSGSIVAIGGAIGGAVAAFFRYQDAQLKVQKAQNAVVRANEAVRKTTENIQAILLTATSNTDAIAAANTRYVAAQARVNELQRQGVTSGEEYNAANKELQDSQAALSAELAKGGGDAKKLTDEMNKLEIQEGKAATQAATLEKGQRQVNQTIMEGALQFATLAGSAVQIGQGLAKVKGGLGGVTTAASTLVSKLGGKAGLVGTLAAVAASAVAVFEAFKAIEALPSMVKLAEQLKTGDVDKVKTAWAAYVDKVKQIPGINELLGGSLDNVSNKLAVASKESETLNRIFPTLSSGAKTAEEGVTNLSGGTQKLGSDMSLSSHQAAELSNMLGQNKDVQDQLTASETKAAPVIGDLIAKRILLGAALAEDIDRYEKSTEMTELQSAAMEKLAGATLTTSQSANAYATVVDKLTQADVDSITKLNEHTRAQLIATAGYNNSKVAAIQYQEALTAMTQSMVQDTDQKNANAAATLTLVNSELNAQNAIATVNEEYANSVDRLADLNTVLGNTEAKQKAVDTVADEFTASLKEQNIELQGTLQALQTVENQEQGVANAILQTKVSLEESNQALREAKAVRDDAAASANVLRTALNEEQTALIEEEAALKASIAAANDSVIMRQRLDNAYLEGVNSIQEWNTELATSAEAEQGAIDALADFGIVFSKLPGYMAPTIENLQLVREAALGSGEAMQEMADMASENFQTMAGEANNLIGGMKDTILEGGKDMKDNWKKNWEEIPQAVRDSMSTAQQEEVKGIAEMQAAAEAAVIELGFDLNTEEFAKARADFTSNLQELAANSDGIWSEMWSRAAELASTGSETMVARISEIIQSGDPPAIMLQQLDAAAKEFGPKGDSMGTDLMNGVGQSVSAGGATLQTRFGEGLRGLTPAATEAGKSAGDALTTGIGQSVSAGGVTLQTRFGEGLRGLPPKAGEAGGQAGTAFVSEWDANVQLAGNALQSIVKTASTLKVQIPITADVSQAHQAIAGLVTKAQSLVVMVTADVSAAHQAIAALVTMKPEPIVVTANTAQAVSALNAASNAALTMRNNFNAASSGVKSAAAGAGAAVASFSSKASSSFAKAGAAGTQMANKVKSASNSMKSSLNSAASSAASFASKCVSSFNKVGSSASSNASRVRQLASAINSLRSKSITVHVGLSGPGVRFLQHGFHGVVNEPMLFIAGEAGPERVDVTPGVSRGSEGGGARGHQNIVRSITAGGGGGGSREVVIPVTLMLDNKVLIRTVRRGLVEEVSGAM